MLPYLVFAVVALAVGLLSAQIATGRLRVDPLVPATTSTPDHGLPDPPKAADVEAVRFTTAPIGYRVEDVDERLSDLAEALAARERRWAERADEVSPPTHNHDESK